MRNFKIPGAESEKSAMRQYRHPEFQRNNPAMPPDWRWRRAVDLVSKGRSASRKRDDEPTCRAIDFLRRLQRVVTERSSRRVTRLYPDIALAMKLRDGPPQRVLELECRVLARQSATIIAEQMMIPRHIVTTFNDLFYAIEERLEANCYIHHFVLGMVPNKNPTPEIWMRWCAYHHGPEIIEAWFDYFAHREESHNLATREGWQRDAIDVFLLAQYAASGVDHTPQFAKNLPQIFRGWQKTHAYSTVESVFECEAKRSLNELPWADAGATAPKSTQPTQNAGCAADFRRTG